MRSKKKKKKTRKKNTHSNNNNNNKRKNKTSTLHKLHLTRFYLAPEVLRIKLHIWRYQLEVCAATVLAGTMAGTSRSKPSQPDYWGMWTRTHRRNEDYHIN